MKNIQRKEVSEMVRAYFSHDYGEEAWLEAYIGTMVRSRYAYR